MSTFPLRVLVCKGKHLPDDSAVRMLHQLGCSHVLLADSGEKAIALLKDFGPVDVALIDVQMVGIDCLDFIQAVGYAGCVESVIISNAHSPELSWVLGEIIALQGLKLLGEVNADFDVQALATLLSVHSCEASNRPSPTQGNDVAADQEIRHALADLQFCTWFQPKFNLLTGSIYGVEALVRWHHPVQGILSPADFLPTLERLGLLDNLLLIQLQSGLEMQQRARLIGHELKVAFNVEAAQLACERFSVKVKQVLQRFNSAGNGLMFELTERTELQTSTATLNNLVRLRMMGCELAIDDFGSGFSSLQRLCELPFTEIKLDRSFTRRFLEEPRSRVAIIHTLALGKMLDIRVVIEGIETPAQRDALVMLGADSGQGYLCAPALLEEQLLEMLDRGSAFKGNRFNVIQTCAC
ncbi:EAL domain-containing response regulator [Pseudomonas sp. SED1]|uniref:EAL domain-containing response regulator n=1 Tax=Pseudomonas sp. SED1 TaxID=3056845 RepID=UPI00296EEC33|nr:EAL domain-containing protein [Pseudomonas sp. SED1]MDY0836535.1 EAL domain-containing protein [Pseudomonas sp. SED1]